MITIDPAVHSVEALEALSVGSPWNEAHAAAVGALDVARDAALAELFPSEATPAGGDAYAALQFYSSGFARGSGYGRSAASLHARCLQSWPQLAALLRDPAFVAMVADISGNDSARHGRETADFAAEMVADYEKTIAGQLVADAVLGHAARALVQVGEMRARVETCVGRHKEHAAAELRRQQEEAAEAARVRDNEERRRVEVARAEAEVASMKARRAVEAARLELAAVLGLRMERTKVKSLYLDGGHCSVSALIPKLTEFSVGQLEALREGLDRGEARA